MENYKEYLEDLIIRFIGENYGSQEMTDPCYDIKALASYIVDDLEKAEDENFIGQGVPFERVRRITGYLVGTTNRWNNAKKAELNDRVTHGKEA